MTFAEFLSMWWGQLIVSLLVIFLWTILSVVFYKPFFKRFYDFTIALISMPFLLFIIIPIAIIVKCEDKGPTFYCGERIGRNGKIFKMIKFRSMKVNAPDIRLADGSTFNGDDDPRVTKIGRFIRKTSIDEFPQLFNILIGQMSIIGPRPDPKDWLNKYTDDEKVFLKARPGLTGYNQAFYRNSSDGKEKIKNDIFYVKNYSIWLDIKIFFKTIMTVLKNENVYAAEDRITNENSDTDVEKQQTTQHQCEEINVNDNQLSNYVEVDNKISEITNDGVDGR